jgi:DNA (cytosine-5)-methyltransferase 1
LIGEVFRLIRKTSVPWVVLENVPFMLQLARGQALEVIVSALEDLGYRWAYRVVDSRAFGLPQRRRRVFLVASQEGDPRDVLLSDDKGEPTTDIIFDGRACGFYWTEGIRGLGWAVDSIPTLKGGSTIGVPSPPAIWLPDGMIVTPEIRDGERFQGFRSGWTAPASDVAKTGARWKLVGNAVSVPVAAWIGNRLSKPGKFDLDECSPLLPGASWPDAAWNVGDGRFAAGVSAWPKQMKAPHLADFLKWPSKMLSARATQGFLSRTERASLRFPVGFIEALRRHLKCVSDTEKASMRRIHSA